MTKVIKCIIDRRIDPLASLGLPRAARAPRTLIEPKSSQIEAESSQIQPKSNQNRIKLKSKSNQNQNQAKSKSNKNQSKSNPKIKSKSSQNRNPNQIQIKSKSLEIQWNPWKSQEILGSLWKSFVPRSSLSGGPWGPAEPGGTVRTRALRPPPRGPTGTRGGPGRGPRERAPYETMIS